MKIREARKIAHYWLDVLGLPEWKEKLIVRWGTAEEMKNAYGLNYIQPEHVESKILLDRSEKRTDYDIEHTIVHEICHLLFDGHKVPSTRYDPMHERALNRLATTLITLDRLGKGL